MTHQKVMYDWEDRAANCLLVALIHYAEDEIRKNTPEATDTLCCIEACIIKFAKLIALGKLDLDIDFLKYYLLRVSPFSSGLKEALGSTQSGGLAFALAEISHYLFSINYYKNTIIGFPDFTDKDLSIMSEAARFVIARVQPDLLNIDKSADMEWIKNNYWDDVRDLLILHNTLNKLDKMQYG
ncbi:hypothetical protein [Methylovulum psychrotolerans]|uniref:Uncharacterized protein n=1 Tax=Methylovulum psychrotolerans TaxID=1704499 RepID=A0A2S5CFG7_9GAMM|nr:hypothetical protein [Methylovulum psychrotolerans]POZ49550.1 hypothetical protein AADEFJLK_04680 [Methylovulum psychrotolerans]